MRIGRLHLTRVGPLRDHSMELEPGLNLIYGRNEAGKTALLDFLVSQLFRREGRRGTRLATVMRGVDRFADTREGQVEVHLDGEVLVYPEAPSLLGELGLGYSGLSGLFCVRSGELEWPEKDEGEFWAALKKLLSGLPEGVETLRKEAHRVGGLTETGQRMNREERPLLDRYRRAEERARRLEELREQLPEARTREEDIARLERELDELDRAREARIAELQRRLSQAREERDDLPELPGDGLDRWHELSVAVEGLEAQAERLQERLREAREARREEAAEAARLEESAREAAALVKRVEDRALVDRARAHLEATAALPGAEGAAPGSAELRVAYGAAAVVLALGAAVVADLLPATVGIAGALAGAAVSAWFGLRHRADRLRARERRTEGRRLVEEAAEAGLDVEAVDEIPASAGRAREEAARAEQQLQVKRVELEHAGEREEELASDLDSTRSELEGKKEEAAEIAGSLDVPSLEEARRLRERRQDVEGRIQTLESALAELGGPDPQDREVAAPEDADELPEWDGERRTRAERELEEARRAYRALRDRFVQAGLGTPEDVLTELESCRSVMEELERDWDAARLAGSIFARMDESLERRLTEVVEGEGPLSAGGVVRTVTGGRYVSVSRREGEGLSVREDGGRRFPVTELSRGTRDQVYLALRIALGREALERAGLEEAGFFLLDDAFLTADWTRRERLVETSTRLAEEGWQVVYLTCDDHLQELFTGAGATLHALD